MDNWNNSLKNIKIDKKLLIAVSGVIFCVMPFVYLTIGTNLKPEQVLLNLATFPLGIALIVSLKNNYFSTQSILKMVTMIFALILVRFTILSETFYASGTIWFQVLTVFSVLFIGPRWGSIILLIFLTSIFYNNLSYVQPDVIIPVGHTYKSWALDVFTDNFLSVFVGLFIVHIFFKSMKKTEDAYFESNKTLSIQREEIHHRNRLAALGAITDSVTHEVNNPLMVISGHAQKLLREIESDTLDINRALRRLEKIEKSNDRLAELTTVLKALSKEDKGSIEERVKWDEVFHKLEGLFFHKFKSSGVRLILDREIIVPGNFKGRKNKLLQLLVNIINHSYERLMEENPKEKFIKVILTSRDSFLNIFIVDSCSNFPEGYELNIFKPLFSSSEEVGTSSANLYYASFLTREMSGKIFIDRCYNDSRITLLLPHH